MINYNGIDFLKGININKISMSKRSIICYRCYFSGKQSSFESTFCNNCHISMLSFYKNKVTAFESHGVDSCIIFWYLWIFAGYKKKLIFSFLL